MKKDFADTVPSWWGVGGPTSTTYAVYLRTVLKLSGSSVKINEFEAWSENTE